jgi:hypothetical protein
MATPSSDHGDGGLRVSWRPVESEKLGQLLSGVADIAPQTPDLGTPTAESHIARARRIVAATPTDAIDRALLLYGLQQAFLYATEAKARLCGTGASRK